MNIKHHFIKAFKEMNIQVIDLILEDNNSYLDAPKDLFINTLNDKFEQLKRKGVSQFDKVIEGTCEKCFVGCPGYSFMTKNDDYFDLLIEMEGDKISDITQCTQFKNKTEVTKEKQVYLYFKKDLRTSYHPSPLEIVQQKEIENAEAQFKAFENSINDLDAFESWLEKWEALFKSVKHMNLSHSFVRSFISTFYNVKSILLLKKENTLADLAITEFKTINTRNAKEVIDWLFRFKENELFYGSGFELTNNWRKTSLLVYKNSESLPNENLKFYSNVIIDVSGFHASVEFSQVYNKYYFRFYDEIQLLKNTR